MSKYTTELRYICESFTADYTNTPIRTIIKNAVNNIYTEDIINAFSAVNHADILENILAHYYTREIAFETFGLWKFHFNNFIRENLSIWTKLYVAADTKFDIFGDVDITRTYEGNGTSKGSSTNDESTNGAQKNTTRYSETPQGGLTGIENDKYLTTATIDTVNNSNARTGNSSTESETQDAHTENVKGKQGTQSYSRMLKEYQNSIFNVDSIIIQSLSTMFFNLW